MRDEADAELALLRLLVALVETRSLARAAAWVRLPQADLPEAIDRLRACLGEPLFACVHDQVIPTRSGLELAAHVRPLIVLADPVDAGGAVERRGPGRPEWRTSAEAPPLRLGYPAAAEPLWVSEALATARLRAPAIQMRFVAAPAQEQAVALRQGLYDLLVTQERPAESGLDAQVILDEPWFVIARVGHPAMGEGWDISAWGACTHLVNRWVLDPALAGRLVDRVCAVPPATRSTSDVPTWIGRLVARSSSIASVPRSIALHAAVHCRVQVAPLPFAVPSCTWWLAWRREAEDSPRHALAREVLLAAAAAHEQRARQAIEHFALVAQRRMRARRRSTVVASN